VLEITQFSQLRSEFDTETCFYVYLGLSWQFPFHQVPYSDIYQPAGCGL